MKFVHPILDSPINFEENCINVLVIENQSAFSELIGELHNQIIDGDGGFVLSSDLMQLDIKKSIDLIIDIFALDFNQKKIINKLYTQLKTISLGSEHYMDTTCLIGEITNYFEKLFEETQYPLSYEANIDIVNIFKLADVKLEVTYKTLAEKLADYMNMMREYCDIKVFTFVNLKCYLSDDEILQFYQFTVYNKFSILLLENTMRDKYFEKEKIRIIDGDLCEI